MVLFINEKINRKCKVICFRDIIIGGYNNDDLLPVLVKQYFD